MATISVTQSTIDTTLQASDIVLLDFWAPWCGPCRAFGPIFEAASERHSDVTFGKVNTEEQQELAAMAGIQAIPTLMAFREGVLVFSQSGALNGPQLDDLISQVANLDMEKIHQEIADERARHEGKTA